MTRKIIKGKGEPPRPGRVPPATPNDFLEVLQGRLHSPRAVAAPTAGQTRSCTRRAGKSTRSLSSSQLPTTLPAPPLPQLPPLSDALRSARHTSRPSGRTKTAKNENQRQEQVRFTWTPGGAGTFECRVFHSIPLADRISTYRYLSEEKEKETCSARLGSALRRAAQRDADGTGVAGFVASAAETRDAACWSAGVPAWTRFGISSAEWWGIARLLLGLRGSGGVAGLAAPARVQLLELFGVGGLLRAGGVVVFLRGAG